ncbi:DUF3301 domain-containing protein [Dasania sp. GY-MA-18]|uniref:DUF3301 domain-containing protein n=1 Tax=Dasania phycosphaerae TaxID=2950436 RepID=A0A9J6RQS0_9GAMM|nr:MULTISPECIES: DUF3301 domain-containing protein [Dasania]MCR8924068.1 DUF3301 domain-containing protein [Dasania sp. GY-MA-18]MCZ0866641.1 DUF3301 domain-containing protein [Dasania phycosphaerae]MCZ0870226.1 DUF3301 domain-containing protein [Dasania phycosphaerae]
MYFSLGDLLLLAAFITLLVYWWRAQGVKQQAFAAVKKHCKEMDVQLLDEGVALRGFWCKRDEQGRLKLWRSFVFEFSSTGNERYQGRVIMLGQEIEKIELQPHRLN